MPDRMPGRPSVLLLTNMTGTETTARLFGRLAEALDPAASARVVALQLPSGIRAKLARALMPRRAIWRAVLAADVVAVHSAVAFAGGYVIGARLLGKRVVAFLWDIYPEPLFDLGMVRPTPLLRLMGRVERLILGLAHAVFVPSADYLAVPRVQRLRRVSVIPMWTYTEPGSLPPRAPDGVLRIGFAGQINPIRDLPGAVAALGRLGVPVALAVWSRDPLPEMDLPPSVTVEHRGFVPQAELDRQLAGMDGGLVSLDPAFRWPAVPSKIFSYVGAGLPVVFHGPPLPALRALLAETGAGLPLEAPDLVARLRALRADFAPRQAAFLNACRLDAAALARVLGP